MSLYELHKQESVYNKILQIILDRNSYKLENELLFNTCDVMLYNIDNVNYNKRSVKSTPILFTIMNSQWNHATKLFYHSLLHFDNYHAFDREFVRKYLSHPNIVASNVKHECIVKSPYFVNKRADYLFAGVSDPTSVLKSKKAKLKANNSKGKGNGKGKTNATKTNQDSQTGAK